ncbi:flavodoxin domain-containing protein [Corynebacterium caspium]|uniref:flavodoxin domain-containing protein n=1 Tax=Corynebacterium caspium TaxID=234828 RepID=UPI000376FE93|nr:flavodoxin domain-containing protein [Corynebacterium caspium]WKD59555.1 Flavodoxin domain protein [Corynebacterium caspium DSM 44850]
MTPAIPTIIYHSVYGSTQNYAEYLAAELGAELFSMKAAKKALIQAQKNAGPVIIMAPTYGPHNAMIDFIRDNYFYGLPVAAVAVGMTLPEIAREKDNLANQLPKDCARFYLPGRLNYSAISQTHRSVMFSLISALRLKPRKNPNDRAMIAGYDKDTDNVDFGELAGIIAWVREVS